MATINTTDLDRRLHAAFTENTGAHFLDSGGAYGRHWERNAGRTVHDFIDAPRATLDGTYGVSLDAFHYLREWCELADDHPAAAALDRIADDNPKESWYGVAELLRDWAEAQDGATTDGWNTYNWENLLSQTLQGYCLTIPQDPRVILVVQIHGGCDVRGGYTRPYVFTIGANCAELEYVEGIAVTTAATGATPCTGRTSSPATATTRPTSSTAWTGTRSRVRTATSRTRCAPTCSTLPTSPRMIGDMAMNLPRYFTCPECERRFDMADAHDADEWNYGHDCEPPTVEHCGHAGTGRWDVTYRWSLRRTYTVTADTAAEAHAAAEEAWANDDGADMAGQSDVFAIPNHAPDDIEVDWAGDDDADTCPDCQGSGYIPAIGPDAPESGYVECDTCHGAGTR